MGCCLIRGNFKLDNDNKYDTIYVISRYNYYVVNDSTLRKELLTDTVHAKDTVLPEFPLDVIRIFRIDTIQ